MFEAGVEIRWHVAELVDHRDDDAPIVVLQQPVEPSAAVGVFQVAQAECGQVLSIWSSNSLRSIKRRTVGLSASGARKSRSAV